MKVCLINPPTTDPRERDLYFPMSLLTLAGVLKACKVEAELWDFELYFKRALNSSEEKFRQLLRTGIKGAKTSIFGISSICSNLPMAIWIAKEIKEYCPDALLILGGPQPSLMPSRILESFPFIDLIVVGEGEITLRELVHAGFDRKRFPEIAGLGYRKGNEVFLTPHRTLVANMDDLPTPDYSLICFDDYISMTRKSFRPMIEVGRGCPFLCTFCSTSLMWERDFRVKSPKRILEEMRALNRAYGFTGIDFIHDNFTTSKRFVAQFCEYLERENREGLTWGCSSRADCLDIDRLERMHRSGLRGIFFGVESGSSRMQKIMKKNLDLTRFEPVLRRVNELRMDASTAFIVGFAEEEIRDLDATVRLALRYKSLGTTRVFIAKLAALSGTKIYQDCVDSLHEFSRPSTVSPQRYGLPYVEELIHGHPDLFSSYYHVPHPIFSSDFLTKFVEFSDLLIEACPSIALTVIEGTGVTPTGLFFQWDRWAEESKIPYAECGAISNEKFKRSFLKFLDETIFDDSTTPFHDLFFPVCRHPLPCS